LYIIIDGTFGIARRFGGTVVRANAVFCCILSLMVRLALQGVSVAQSLEQMQFFCCILSLMVRLALQGVSVAQLLEQM
jgi:predicted nuclease with RNAse H fold